MDQIWLTSTDPFWRLRGLPSPDDRKLRLFACACARQVAHLTTDPFYLQTVDLAERYSDGQATPEELESVRITARARYDRREDNAGGYASLLYAAYCVVRPVALEAAIETCSCALGAWADTRRAELKKPSAHRKGWKEMTQVALTLQSDVFANPFEPLPAFDPQWRSSNNGAVLGIAQQIYEERDGGRLMGVLADALEESGCREAAILDHCRNSFVHVRGCWLLDLILNKG
jgi:hypothetical protein